MGAPLAADPRGCSTDTMSAIEFLVHSAGAVERDGALVGVWSVDESRTGGFVDLGGERAQRRSRHVAVG